MKPFVLLQTRPEAAAADNEYEAFRKFSGLDTKQLIRHRIHAGGLPELVLEDYSGIFIGGGPYCVTTDQSRKSPSQKACEADLRILMRQVLEADFPLLAACYSGIVVESAGGTLDREHPEIIGAYEIRLTAEGGRDPLLSGLSDSFLAFSGHKESVRLTPPESVVLVSADTCPVHMLRVKKNIYACQFHPELDNDGLALRVRVYKNHGYFPPEAADELIAEAARYDVGEPVKIIDNFVKIYIKTKP
jgi:GMP synthase (glutamine-hydrolysing)